LLSPLPECCSVRSSHEAVFTLLPLSASLSPQQIQKTTPGRARPRRPRPLGRPPNCHCQPSNLPTGFKPDRRFRILPASCHHNRPYERVARERAALVTPATRRPHAKTARPTDPNHDQAEKPNTPVTREADQQHVAVPANRDMTAGTIGSLGELSRK
jgi:hypothetical protein